MNVVDSSCWLEFFAGSEVGGSVAPIVEDSERLIVPSVTLYEVFEKLLTELDEDKALFAVAHMRQGKIVALDSDLAVYSAKMGRDKGLALADSIIYAIARRFDATLWTQDKHFRGLDSVRYFEKGGSND